MRRGAAVAMLLSGACLSAHGLEHVTLRNGFAVDCERRVVAGDRVRLYFAGSGATADSADGNFMEVAADAVLWVEPMAAVTPGFATAVAAPLVLQSPAGTGVAPPVARRVAPPPGRRASQADGSPSRAELQEMLSEAGAAHHIDSDLLASVVRAESGGQTRAVSRTGARGLMQLMPGTAKTLGVQDAFAPQQNIAGGTAYLDGLLVRYHDNIALALAAYNAGPGAVDRYHGVPPYAETRAYVARVIREFNRRKQTALVAQTR